MQIVTGRRGEPHVTSRQMQAVYRSFLGDFALLDIGEKLRAEAYSNDIVRVYDGVVSVQGIYAVIAYNQYDEVYIEPVSVGKKRIDTIVLHYTKDNALDVEDMQLDVVQGEEYTDNPVPPTISEGGDAWEGTTDIQVPIYDVEVTNFGLTVTPYSRMLTVIPTLDSIAERIPETVVTGVKGDSEVLYRDGDVNITKANIGLGNVDNTADTDKPISTATQTALNGKVDKVAGKGLSTEDYTTTDKTKLAGISEGATQTIANPADTATETLSKLEVGGVVYDVPQGASGATELSELTDVNLTDVEDNNILQYDETANKWKNSNALQGSKTTTGNPITVTDAAPVNAVDVSVDVEPIQDLHGYDHPWVGGAGKNKLPMTVDGIKAANSAFAWNGNVAERYGATTTILTDGNDNVIGIKVNGTPSSQLEFYMPLVSNLGNAIINGCPASGSDSTYFITSKQGSTWSGLYDYGNGYEREITSNESVVIVIRSGYNAQNLIFYPMIRLSTETDATFAPYTNICPITGQTEVVIEDVGKNLLNPITVTFQRYLKSDGSVGITGGSDWSYTDYIKIEAGETYTLSGVSNMGTLAQHCFYDENKNLISSINTTEYTFTAPANAKFVRLSNHILNYSSVMLEKNNQSSTYEPYKGKTYRVEIGQKNKVEETLSGYTIVSTGLITVDSNNTFDMQIAKIKKGVTYTITTDDIFCVGYFTEKPANGVYSYDNQRHVDTNQRTFTAPITGYIAFRTNKGYTTPQCEQGSQATPYVPYNPNLPDAIYGGELDVVTGELRVTHGEVDLGDLSWTFSGGFFRTSDLIPIIKKPINNQTMVNAISSAYPIMTWTAISTTDTAIAVDTTGNMIVANPNITNVSDFKTAVTGQTLVYELATPYTIQLTPQQIRLLKGTNNITCNTGDLSIKYYPDNVLGQLKGDIEGEYDAIIQNLLERIEALENQQ